MSIVTVIVNKGGKGSGFHGHAGRPGKVGGSLSEGNIGNIQTNLDENDPYIIDLANYCRDIIETKYKGEFNAPDELYYFGYRALRGAGDFQRDFAIAKHVEERTDRETMLKVLVSSGNWTGSPRSSKEEWAAMRALYGDGAIIPKDVDDISDVNLSDKELEGYKARQEYYQALFRDVYGEDAKLYRGVRGAYAGKLRKSLTEKGSEALVKGDRTITVKSFGLVSFSPSRYSAATFASSKSGKLTGLLFSKVVKASNVWLMPRDAGVTSPIHFMEDHGEVVTYDEDSQDDWFVEDW